MASMHIGAILPQPYHLWGMMPAHYQPLPTPCAHEIGTPLKLSSNLERFHQLSLHETQLFQNLQEHTDKPSSSLSELGRELNTILSQKIQEVTALVGDEPILPTDVSIMIHEQPFGNVVANKYLEPAVQVKVNPNLLWKARQNRLQVRASLCFSLTGQPIARTLDNKQDILQGIILAPVPVDGAVTFNKLKIMEVSSKHHHQAFSIQLQLEELISGPNGDVYQPLGELLKTEALHVQSRINKRRRSLSETEHAGKTKKRFRPGESDDCTYVDITALLVLPQKEAANKLGISESMLCKRFKECTRRKWPYRYLRKIDKMIKGMMIKRDGSTLPTEEQMKIDHLQEERKQCLEPLKIRISGKDELTASGGILGSSQDGSSEMEDEGSQEMDGDDFGEFDDDEDEDELAVVEALAQIRQGHIGVAS